MKATTFGVAAVGLLQFAVAQPHRPRHEDKHAKRDVVVTVINTVYASPTEAPEVVVFVNQFGVPVSTMSEEMIAVPWSSAIAPVPAPSPAPAAPAPAPAAPAPVAAVQAPASSSEGSGFGFAYSPYNADGTCKSQGQVNTDFDAIPGGYSFARTYGTDCNQVATVLTAAKAKGLKLFVGIFDMGTLSQEVATIVAAASNDWDSIHTVSVGNELVNNGAASAPQMVAAIGTVRALLRNAGYNGPVVTVDTLIAARNNPSLCAASDYCAVNCHPFFDPNTPAGNSGSFLTTQIASLRAVLSNPSQEIVITETGWPWQGQANGAAVPSPANQQAALSSIRSTFSSNPAGVVLFTPFNDLWKTSNAAQFGAEQFWGYIGNSPSG